MPSSRQAALCSAAWSSAACRCRPSHNKILYRLNSMPSNTDTITITRPDDCHLHLRDGAVLISVVADTVRQFARAIVMPNLQPPVTTTEQALAYRERIIAALAIGRAQA